MEASTKVMHPPRNRDQGKKKNKNQHTKHFDAPHDLFWIISQEELPNVPAAVHFAQRKPQTWYRWEKKQRKRLNTQPVLRVSTLLAQPKDNAKEKIQPDHATQKNQIVSQLKEKKRNPNSPISRNQSNSWVALTRLVMSKSSQSQAPLKKPKQPPRGFFI
jgi:hypothetical protein